MNKLMRKLSISILAVVFAVIAMGATTYAWFTLTNTTTVDQFDVDVTTAEGIELSMDNGVTWSSVITNTQFNAGLTAQSKTKPALTAVASVTGDANFKVLTNLPSAGEGTFDVAAAGTHYLEFNIMVRTTTGGQPIFLSNANTAITSNPIEWLVDKTFTPVSGGEVIVPGAAVTYTVNPADAVRISFDEDATHVFETAAVGTNTTGQSFDWSFGALNYYQSDKGYVSPTNPVNNADNVGATYTLHTLGTPYLTKVATTSATATNGYYQTTITVRIWLDGWDAQCYNAIFGGQLAVKIGFTTLTSAA